MFTKLKNSVLILGYLFILANVSFHHHNETELLPELNIVENESDHNHLSFIDVGNCPVVHFASNGFACPGMYEYDMLSFENKLNYYRIYQSTDLLKSFTNISLRAPPVV